MPPIFRFLLLSSRKKNNVGKIVGPGSDIEPDTPFACGSFPVPTLPTRSAAVRFCMAHTYAGRLFNKAAAEKDPDVVKIISDATKVPAPLIAAAAPRWTWYTDDGSPNVELVMAQFKFVSQSMNMVSGQVTPDMLFDLAVAEEANERLKTTNPFDVSGRKMGEEDVAIECDDISLTYSAKSGTPVEALQRVSFRINLRGYSRLSARRAAVEALAPFENSRAYLHRVAVGSFC